MRPRIDYCAQAWSLCNIGDRDILEAVQRRAVGMVTDLRGRTYEEQLAELGMVTLEKHCERGDLIQAYKILSGKDQVNPQTRFTLIQPREIGTTTRSAAGSMNVVSNEGRTELCRNFWSVRVCDSWNRLPDNIKDQATTNGYENAIDNHLYAGQVSQS